MSTKKLRRKISVKKKNTKKGGQYGSEKIAEFVEFNNIIDDNCTICQEPLNSSEKIKTNGIVYQLTCGHQFHTNCLKRLCEKETDDANRKSNVEKRPPENFSCPICRDTTLKEDHDCTSVNELYPIGPVNKEYKTRKYTGIPEKNNRFGKFANFFRKKTGGKTKSRKTKKVRQNRKKQIR
tara:strand:- start:26929 stop:27468 length:540 start_codon:yes stop_codon:yes gene_type:complete